MSMRCTKISKNTNGIYEESTMNLTIVPAPLHMPMVAEHKQGVGYACLYGLTMIALDMRFHDIEDLWYEDVPATSDMEEFIP